VHVPYCSRIIRYTIVESQKVFFISVVLEDSPEPPESPVKRNSASEKLRNRNDSLYVRNPLQAGEFEIAVSIFYVVVFTVIKRITPTQNSKGKRSIMNYQCSCRS